MPKSHLILGGRRSGKSAFAENLALASGLPKIYLATSRAYDADHAARIACHKTRREGQGWRVVEVPNPMDVPPQLDLLAQEPAVVLLDCLSMWLNNLFLDRPLDPQQDHGPNHREVPDLILPKGQATLLVVSSEVGLGIHPETALGRQYADALGTLNQSIAAQADQVTLVTAGLPLCLKSS